MIATSFHQFWDDYSTEIEQLYWHYVHYRAKHRIWPELEYHDFALFIYDYSRADFPIKSGTSRYLQLSRPIIHTSSYELIADILEQVYDIYIIQEASRLRDEMSQMIGDLPLMDVPTGHSPWLLMLQHGYHTGDYWLNMTKDTILRTTLTSEEYDQCVDYFKGTVYALEVGQGQGQMDRDDGSDYDDA
jgi:hypothetical protein